jgi:hypothetical protein
MNLGSEKANALARERHQQGVFEQQDERELRMSVVVEILHLRRENEVNFRRLTLEKEVSFRN